MAKLIGNEPNQVPTNGDLGKLAFQEPEAVNITGGTLDSVTVTNLTTDGASLDGAVVINEAGADVDFRIESDTNANAFFVDGATGNVGVGTSSPNGKLNIVGSYHQQLILQNTTADSAVKGATFNGAHYTNSEEPLLLGATYSNSTENVCYYGGGWSAANTATSLQFYTAANNTTTTGTERMRITSSGNVGIGTSSPSSKVSIIASGVNGLHLGQQSDNTANSGRLFFDNSTNIWTAYSTTGNFKIASGASLGSSSGTDRLVIDSSGRVGIGTSSPDLTAQLHTKTTSATARNIIESTSSAGYSGYRLKNASGYWETQIDGSNQGLRWLETMTERMRIDSSGNLLVGKTAADSYNTTNGVELQSSGLIAATRTGIAQILNREDSDGDIAVFRKDGTTVGSIGVNSGALQISGGSSSGMQFNSTHYVPMQNGSTVDATIDLGSTGRRFKDLYLSGGVYFGTSGSTSGSGTETSNKLDDYEEGTFTFTLTGSTGAPSTPQTTTGYYTKIGRFVTVSAYFNNKNLTGASGNLIATGLPFTSNSNSTNRGAHAVALYGFSFSGNLYIDLVPNSTTAQFQESRNNTSWAPIVVSATSNRYIQVTINYMTS